VFLDAQAKVRLWFIPAIIALVMFSTESGGNATPGGQGRNASLGLTNVQEANPARDSGRSSTSSGAEAEAVALLSSNLVAHWEFDEQSGIEAVDSSGQGNHGTLRNFPRNTSQWVAGRIGGGLRFNTDASTNNVVIVPDSASLNFTNELSFTLAIWVRSQAHEIDTLLNSQLETMKLAVWVQNQAQQIDHAGIICKGAGMGGEQFAVDVYEGKFRFYTRPATGSPSTPVISAVAPSGRWQHLIATFDGQAHWMALYVDGRLAGSQHAPDSLQCTTHEVSIGCRESNQGSPYNLPFKGIIDDVRIYNRALSAVEVRTLYDSAGPWPAIIYRQPKGASRHVGEGVVFFTEADGTGSLKYQWQKNGQDIRDAATPRLQLSNLGFQDAGVYTVQVTDANGTITSSNAVVTMVPYFWQSRWFLVMVVPLLLLGVAGAVYLIEKRKSRQAVERLEHVHAIDGERMRIARDMHDEIGSKLSRISLLSDMARQTVSEGSTARKQIDEVSEAARDIVQSVDEIVWAVNPRHDTLESLVNYIRGHAEEFFEMTTMELEFEQSDVFPVVQLSAETRHNLFCAVKEALNNVLKHAAASRVRISFTLSEASFQIAIEDNGCGFVPQTVSTAGNGLFNIRERLKSVRGECSIESQPGDGTVVLFTVPLTETAQPTSKGA
jgi:signal transduction histidine kinase